MDSSDLEVLKTCDAWIRAGKSCQLVTVVKTWGSSPRQEGATLALNVEGGVVGSVSGGCIEDDLITSARTLGIFRSLPKIVTYGVSKEDAYRFGLPCGGTIQLAIEPLSEQSQISELLSCLQNRELVARHLNLATGEVSLEPAEPGMALTLSEDMLSTVYGPRWRLLIIGAGQLSSFLAQIAVGMDYYVTVCDPREEYRGGWAVSGVRVVHGMPDDEIIEMRLDHRSAVVALTHDPKIDDLALIEALKSDAFYVGAIGSRRNNAQRRERLALFDLNEAQIAKLRGPIGIYLGSKTPSEIAISILAEMTAVKNGVMLAKELSVQWAKDWQGASPTATICEIETQ